MTPRTWFCLMLVGVFQSASGRAALSACCEVAPSRPSDQDVALFVTMLLSVILLLLV
jgi:hypothetical protein